MGRNIMSQLSFDGFGINGPDKYRSRVATFTNDEAGKAYGKLFEASPDLLSALQACLPTLEERAAEFGVESEPLKLVRAAIAKATGGAK